MKFLTVFLTIVLLGSLVVSAFVPFAENMTYVYLVGFVSAMALQSIVFMKAVKQDEVPQAQA
jgi:uncharacterized membrane protein YwzB